jgi:hypothetical protein
LGRSTPSRNKSRASTILRTDCIAVADRPEKRGVRSVERQSATELTSEIELPILLARILSEAGELTDTQAGSVIHYDEERKGLYFAAATGPAAATVLEKFGERSSERVPIGKSKAGVVFQTGRSIREDSVATDLRHFKGVDEQTKAKTDSMVCVPLSIGSERIESSNS